LFPSTCVKFLVQSSGWTERFKQVHRHYLALDSDQIPLNFLLQFSFDYLIFLSMFCCALVQTLSNCRNRKSSDLEEMSVNIRQAASFSLWFHRNMQFTHQVDIWIYFMHTVLVYKNGNCRIRLFKALCQSLDGVYNCFDPTECNVI